MRQWLMIVPMFLLFPGLAAAEAEVTIGYVDMQILMNKSKAGGKAKAEIKKLVDQKQAALKKDEDKIKAMHESLEKDKLLLSKEQRSEKENKIRGEMAGFQQKVAQSQQALKQKEAELTRKMHGEIAKIIADVAKNKKVAMVIERNSANVLYAQDGLDLTEDVLKRYDKK